jgi:hypothetical protein
MDVEMLPAYVEAYTLVQWGVDVHLSVEVRSQRYSDSYGFLCGV